MLSGENMSYLMERGHGVVDRIKFIGNNYTVITDPAQIPEDIVKVSVYLVDGVEPFVERFVPKWQQANCARGGTQVDRYHRGQQWGLAYRASAVCWTLTRRM